MGVITVGIADCQSSNQQGDTLVTHALGSCVAVAVHDKTAGVAGLLHIMLPESALNREKARTQPFMFADTGISQLFDMVQAKGADKKRLTVRLIGGAQVMDPNGVFNIGSKNHAACRRILWAAGVLVHGEEVGGSISRTVRLEVATGRLQWNSGGGPAHELAAKGGI